jgi:hypothetical protein
MTQRSLATPAHPSLNLYVFNLHLRYLFLTIITFLDMFTSSNLHSLLLLLYQLTFSPFFISKPLPLSFKFFFHHFFLCFLPSLISFFTSFRLVPCLFSANSSLCVAFISLFIFFYSISSSSAFISYSFCTYEISLFDVSIFMTVNF